MLNLFYLYNVSVCCATKFVFYLSVLHFLCVLTYVYFSCDLWEGGGGGGGARVEIKFVKLKRHTLNELNDPCISFMLLFVVDFCFQNKFIWKTIGAAFSL